MASLPSSQVELLLEECARRARERQQIAAVLAAAPSSVGEIRKALNRLASIVTG